MSTFHGMVQSLCGNPCPYYLHSCHTLCLHLFRGIKKKFFGIKKNVNFFFCHIFFLPMMLRITRRAWSSTPRRAQEFLRKHWYDKGFTEPAFDSYAKGPAGFAQDVGMGLGLVAGAGGGLLQLYQYEENTPPWTQHLATAAFASLHGAVIISGGLIGKFAGRHAPIVCVLVMPVACYQYISCWMGRPLWFSQ